MLTDQERWQLHAKWVLGEITDSEYADVLECDNDGIAGEILAKHLRKKEGDAEPE